jgi:hypothetical protein
MQECRGHLTNTVKDLVKPLDQCAPVRKSGLTFYARLGSPCHTLQALTLPNTGTKGLLLNQ